LVFFLSNATHITEYVHLVANWVLIVSLSNRKIRGGLYF